MNCLIWFCWLLVWNSHIFSFWVMYHLHLQDSATYWTEWHNDLEYYNWHPHCFKDLKFHVSSSTSWKLILPISNALLMSHISETTVVELQKSYLCSLNSRVRILFNTHHYHLKTKVHRTGITLLRINEGCIKASEKYYR